MSKKNYFKERIILLILLFAFMTPFGALAQTIQLTGLVTDAANEPIIGASVVEKGTTNGVITDFDGNFTIVAPSKKSVCNTRSPCKRKDKHPGDFERRY